MEDEFIGYEEGYLTTTDIDLQNDQLTPEDVESFADQLKRRPSLRTLFLKHDTTQAIGYIVDFHVEKRGNWRGLWAKIGIFKKRADVWEMIQSGELKGFSYGAKRKMQKKTFDKEYSFVIEAKVGGDYHQISDLLLQSGADVDVIVQKAVDFPTIFNVACTALSLPGTIYGLYTLSKKLVKPKTEADSGSSIKVKTIRKTFDFESNTVEEIVNEIEIYSKSKK